MEANQAMRLKRQLAHVPVTAVAFYRDPATKVLYVLAGEDTDLVVYRATSSRSDSGDKGETQVAVVSRMQMLHAQPIHGIHVHQPSEADAAAAISTGRVLLWGGSSVAIFKTSDLNLKAGSGRGDNNKNGTLLPLPSLPLIARLRAPDWIYDGAISTLDANHAVLVTAHNEVITMRYDENTGTAALSSGLVSPSRPMLYAANVRWTSGTEVLVAAGTVFGDILVWKHAFGGADDDTQKPQTLFSLSGHEGSIFGIHMSPLMEMPDGSVVRLLASCSDDRTIRIWNITESEASEKNVAKEVSVTVLREASDTGFRCVPAAYAERNDASGVANGRVDISPVATAMGHASRIWGVKFGVPNVDELICDERQRWGSTDGKCLSLYSFGEDATVQKWTVDIVAALQQPQLSKISHEKTYALHNGKHLWSGDTLCCVEGGITTTYVLSGGSDSRITLMKETADMDSRGTDMYSSAETWDMHNIIPLPQQPVPATTKPRKELISRYDFLTPDVLLAVSNLGTLWLATFVGKDTTWQGLVVEDEAAAEDMKNVYSLRTVSHGAALLGSTTGGVYYFGLRDKRIEKVASLAGRVVEMNALSKALPGATGRPARSRARRRLQASTADSWQYRRRG
ncbi:hypothetical protein NQ176_g10869 [Zarea fungicola]|uniref:Uncharacterized protein n=1 Tax=Zarea fungicola TaxID=93591 RepID=A0ACC1ME95_9HYPO|nr:hypothetical protein NQ176_g10869 [Lecanicillium fungicola]